jgi:hypothetical protein
MARDDFKAITVERLGQRVNYRCSNPYCAAQTSGPSWDSDRPVSVGVAAHITAASPGGPRYDDTLTPEQRQSFANGIWLCNNCSRRVDADPAQYTSKVLQEWKTYAETQTAKGLGVPTAIPTSNLARISPARRFGSDVGVIVKGRLIAFTNCGMTWEADERVTWFVQAFAVQLKVRKRDAFASIVIDGLEATVHDYQPVPDYEPMYGAYPVESSLYVIDLDRTIDGRPRQFSATRFYERTEVGETELYKEEAHVVVPVVVDDADPHAIVARFDARTPGLYTVSLDILLSAGEMTERCQVMEPRQIIFDAEPNYDED